MYRSWPTILSRPNLPFFYEASLDPNVALESTFLVYETNASPSMLIRLLLCSPNGSRTHHLSHVKGVFHRQTAGLFCCQNGSRTRITFCKNYLGNLLPYFRPVQSVNHVIVTTSPTNLRYAFYNAFSCCQGSSFYRVSH